MEIPASRANVARPDDLFELPPGQWHLAKSFALGREPCVPEQCEAGFTSGDLVVSVEHARSFVLVIAGVRGCERTAFAEIEVADRPGSSTFRRIAKRVRQVVKGLAETCRVSVPDVPKLEASQLFPRPAG